MLTEEYIRYLLEDVVDPELINNVKLSILKLTEVDKVDVQLVWMPMWNSEMMTDEARDITGYSIF